MQVKRCNIKDTVDFMNEHKTIFITEISRTKDNVHII